MAYGLADVVNQRRMIDESPADDEFKRVQRGKLDALLSLAEAADCRRVRLLAYFGETGAPCAPPQNLCDNCLNPPALWDATEPARKLLSCIYRFTQHGLQHHGARSFGAGHLIDVLRGKVTDKVSQYSHQTLSTFGCGADLDEAHWRAVLRQLVAQGHVQAEGEYNTLAMTDSARAVLKGEQGVLLRRPSEGKTSPGRRSRLKSGATAGRAGKAAAAPIELGAAGEARYAALRAWRAEVAREHSLPAYVIFHDATLAEMAARQPGSLAELAEISGVGAKKLDAYGEAILQVLAQD
jgi:ATP-dependent DNA helicase RecQ